MSSQTHGGTDQSQILLADLPPTLRQTRAALAVATVLLLGLAVLGPFAAKPLPQVNGFHPTIAAIMFLADFITASLFLAQFSITRSRALLPLACGYLFSAAIVVANGLTFPNFRVYLLWHLGLPAALFAYIWLRNKDNTKASVQTTTEIVTTVGVACVLALVSCIACLALLPPVDPVTGRWFTAITMLVCAAALAVLWVFRRSALDQWLMVVVLTMLVELTITTLIGGLGPRIVSHGFYSLGFYTGRLLSLVTSTVILIAQLAETSKLYASLARVNALAGIVDASRALSSEIVLPKLIDRLMKIVIDNAGADRGLLILPSGNGYLIQAEARLSGDQIEVTMRQEPITLIACPESLVQHVIRTRGTVILDDASKPNLFSGDNYLRDRQSKSVLCLPLIKQGELTGILLLENTLTTHVFTPERARLLELLASQAAISLQNTRLYGDLQEREAKVRRLVDSNIIGICIFDLDRRILEANDAFLGTVGYSRDDLISGRLSFAGLTPPEWVRVDERLLAELASTGTWRPCEKEFFQKAGSRVPVLVGGATFGELRQQGVAFVIDLSERKRAEAELAHSNRVATMGQLTATIVHEVSQPIAGLLINAETTFRRLARKPPEVEEAKESINRIIRDANRVADIVRRIRDFSKKAPMQRGDLEINETIVDIVNLARDAMSGNSVLMTMQLSEALPRILGDRVQLQQVILNLIMNAIDAMSEVRERSRELLIGTSTADSDGVLVTVTDSGSGLPHANPDRIFDAFYTTKASGLGMGLSICRSIVEAHGGRLWATANEPHGAVFCMLLPVGGKSLESLECAKAYDGQTSHP